MAPATSMVGIDRDMKMSDGIRWVTIQEPPKPTPPVVHPVRPRSAARRRIDTVVAIREAANVGRPASRRLTMNPKKLRRIERGTTAMALDLRRTEAMRRHFLTLRDQGPR